MKLYAGYLSIKGNYRKKNQDRVYYREHSEKGQLLAVGCVCDGIGSFEQSEIAAEMVQEGIERWFLGIEDLYPDQVDEETLLDDLEFTIRELNELIWTFRKEQGIDIGCTMSLLLFLDKKYYVFHVGDSKIFLLDTQTSQITRDEVSLVEHDGRIRSLLANFMGKASELWLNQSSGSLKAGETFVIGSDGLFKRLENEILLNAAYVKIKSNTEAEQILKKMIQYVTDLGEKDNISGVLVRTD